MPELPEVESVCRGLKKSLGANAVISDVKLTRRDLRVPVPKNFAAKIKGQVICEIRRRAKFLLIDTPEHTIINHLGMSGSWRFVEMGDERKHDHCYLVLGDQRRLAFNDPRRFGLIELVKRGEEMRSKWLKNLGVEPMTEAFSAAYMFAAARKREVPVKNFIMDQKIVVGVGNIYASEALFKAGIKPTRAAGRLRAEDWQKMVEAINAVLMRAISFGGTTLQNHALVSGERGEFQLELDVYDRAGALCKVCKEKIFSRVLGGRSTYWCKVCQK